MNNIFHSYLSSILLQSIYRRKIHKIQHHIPKLAIQSNPLIPVPNIANVNTPPQVGAWISHMPNLFKNFENTR